MSFRPLSPPVKWSGSAAATRVAVRVTRAGIRLKLILAGGLLKKLGWPADGRFSVAAGEGESAGRLRVAADPEGDFSASLLPKKGGGYLTLGALPGLAAQAVKARDALHAVGAEGGVAFVEITLPAAILEDAPRTAQRSSPPQTAPHGPKAAAPGKSSPAASRNSAPAKTEMRGAGALRLTDGLFALLCAKAGIAFGCDRIDVLVPAEENADRAQGALAAFLAARGVSPAEIGKRLKLEGDDIAETIAAPAAFNPYAKAQESRFLALAEEAIKLARMAA